jgi:hypothetical protein
MSKRKGESPAEYSKRMSDYQRIRRLKEAGLPIPDTLGPRRPTGTRFNSGAWARQEAPGKRYFPRGGRPRSEKPREYFTPLHPNERPQSRITLPGKFVPDKYAAEPPKPKCFGDLRREAMERAGLVGPPPAPPSTDTDVARAAHTAAIAEFKAQVRPIIAALAGRIIRIDMILADVGQPDGMTPGAAVMAVAGVLGELGAERLRDHRWKVPDRPTTVSATTKRVTGARVIGEECPTCGGTIRYRVSGLCVACCHGAPEKDSLTISRPAVGAVPAAVAGNRNAARIPGRDTRGLIGF